MIPSPDVGGFGFGGGGLGSVGGGGLGSVGGGGGICPAASKAALYAIIKFPS